MLRGQGWLQPPLLLGKSTLEAGAGSTLAKLLLSSGAFFAGLRPGVLFATTAGGGGAGDVEQHTLISEPRKGFHR